MASRRVCPECDKRRILTDAGKCIECSGGSYGYRTQDESPGELDPSGWVKVGNTLKHRDAFGRAS